MSDEFDGCECVWSHEIIMRRLLSVLRNRQDYCIDTECFQIPPPEDRIVGTDFTMMIGFMIFAMVMYMMRPSSMRSSNKGINKALPEPPNGSNDDGPNNGPPPTVG